MTQMFLKHWVVSSPDKVSWTNFERLVWSSAAHHLPGRFGPTLAFETHCAI